MYLQPRKTNRKKPVFKTEQERLANERKIRELKEFMGAPEKIRPQHDGDYLSGTSVRKKDLLSFLDRSIAHQEDLESTP
jgi:hypothetical protein